MDRAHVILPLMRERAIARPDPVVEDREWTVEDFDAYTGVVSDRTGDYQAGRTTFHPSGEDLIAFLESMTSETE